ncbi:MAG TPA: HAD-IIB family hydrolase, partial [Mycoplasmatales bacterium]|nr:HAD-IIB family hydrolase [Mycoplasmatales bacterium]
MKSYKNPDHLLSKKERFLIVFDLDGTALEADYETFNKLNKRVLKYLSNKGHIVCIATGKNYLSALPYYKELDLNTYLVTYNGALISNPFFGNEKVKNFAPISNDIAKTILSDPKIKNELRECLVDTVDNETISTSENVYWKEVFFNNNPYVAGDILSHL